MSRRRQNTMLVVLLLSLILAFVGQYYLSRKRDYMWDGLVFYAVAMLLFAWVLARLEGGAAKGAAAQRSRFWAELWGTLGAGRLRLTLLLLGSGAIVWAALAAHSRPGDRPFWDLLSLWAAGVACVLGAFVAWRSLPQRLGQAARRALQPEALFVVVLALATFALRIVDLGNIPYVLSGDEASMGLEACGVLDGTRNSPFVTGWLSHPTLFFFLQAFSLDLFGRTTWALRLPSPLVSVAILVLLYLLARRLFGRRVAVLSGLFFVGYHYAIHFGRIALNNIWDPFFALGALFFVIRGLDTRRVGDMALGGFFLGLAVYFYMGARLIPIMLVVYLLYRMAREPGFWREQRANLVVAALVALLVALPLLVFYSTHLQDMMARWKMVNIFSSGWVQSEALKTGRSAISLILEQFLKSVLAFNYYPDPTFHYRPGIPLLRMVDSIFFVFGLACCGRNWRRSECFLVASWFLLVVIFGGTLLENPPASARLVIVIPAVVMAVALGVAKLADVLQRLVGQPRYVAVGLSLAITVAMSGANASFYLESYTPSHTYGGLNTEVADRMGKYLHSLGSDYHCYFFGAPRMYYGFSTIPFLAQGVAGTDVLDPIQDTAGLVEPDGKRPVFVFLPERITELDVVRRFYPGGTQREFRDENQVLFIAYEMSG